MNVNAEKEQLLNEDGAPIGTISVKGEHTGLSLRLDAVGVMHGTDAIGVLSAAGSETAVKSLVAALRSDARIEFDIQVPGRWFYKPKKHAGGYKVYRHKINANTWHVLCLARQEGLMPVLSEEAVWQEFRSERYTTPILREWVMPLMEAMIERNRGLEIMECFGCRAAVLTLNDEALASNISAALEQGILKIPGSVRLRQDGLAGIGTLEDYLTKHGRALGQQAERSLSPLHVPGRDELPERALLRHPFEAQAHVVEAVVKALNRQKAVLIVAEMGSGKTIQALAAAHAHAAGQPYRALVMCPGQLVQKWGREVATTIPGATVTIIESWRDLTKLDRNASATGAEWFVIGRDRAKLGAKWRAAFNVSGRLRYPTCPSCGRILADKDGVVVKAESLARKRQTCEQVLEPALGLIDGCGEHLWQMTGELDRYEPALFIKRHLKNYFAYFILDEVHEAKSATSAQANAAGALIAATRKTIALTGTLLGGYADHIRPLLFRLAARSLVNEGLAWNTAMPFNERYGRIETRVTEKDDSNCGDDNAMSRGSSRTSTKYVRPGVMPPLYGRHMLDKTIFLSLAEVAEGLPALNEECLPVAMDAEQQSAYEVVEKDLMDVVKEMARKGDKRMLGRMLMTLLAYPDHPFGWGPIGYWDKGEDNDGEGSGCFITVSIPENLDEAAVRPKEQALIDLCLEEKGAGRKVWAYVQFTTAWDVQGRLERLLKANGLKVGVLRASVTPAEREEWIAKNAPKCDVILSHPKLVETGLDFFNKAGTFVIPTIVFYETGYSTFTLRQAARRAWRIGQKLPCRIVYLYYAGTMQEKAMMLMGKKLAASLAIEGQFSAEGLAALTGEDDGNAEMALAKSLGERINPADVRRTWNRVTANTTVPTVQLPDPTMEESDDSLTGPEVVARMKTCRSTIKAWAAKFHVTEYCVRAWRKSGVMGDMARTIRAGAAEAPSKERKPCSKRASSKRDNRSPC
jgi:SNF2 family DNA or RNA helicase